MSIFKKTSAITVVALLSVASVSAGDWPMFGHDPQRTGSAPDEKLLSVQKVAGMTLLWKVKLNNPSFSLSALTAPVVASQVATDSGTRSIVYVGGWNGTVYALDAATGKEVWTRSLKTMSTPKIGGMQGTFHCPGGITATPAINESRSIIYFIAPDGALYGLDTGTGTIRFGPVPFVAPFSKNWSLNVSGTTIYTTVSLGCGNGSPGVYSADVRDRNHTILRESLLSKVHTAGIWGRGGPVIGKNGRIYGGTSDGNSDIANGDYSNSVVSLSQSDLSIADYFLPHNWEFLRKEDLDMASASPVWFRWRGRNLLAHSSKEGMLRLLDADSLGAKDHQTALAAMKIGNDQLACCTGFGVWGSLSVANGEDGETWLYVPVGGPPSADGPAFPLTNGPSPHGSIMAFKITGTLAAPGLQPVWISEDFSLPDPVVTGNGVVYSLSNGENADQRGDESKRFLNTHPAELKALDAKTGKLLFASGSAIASWVHFSGIALSDGRIYVVDHDSNVYCFGLRSPDSTNGIAPGAALASSRDVDASELGASWVNRVEHAEDYRRIWMRRVAATLGVSLCAGLVGLGAAIMQKQRT